MIWDFLCVPGSWGGGGGLVGWVEGVRCALSMCLSLWRYIWSQVCHPSGHPDIGVLKPWSQPRSVGSSEWLGFVVLLQCSRFHFAAIFKWGSYLSQQTCVFVFLVVFVMLCILGVVFFPPMVLSTAPSSLSGCAGSETSWGKLCLLFFLCWSVCISFPWCPQI